MDFSSMSDEQLNQAIATMSTGQAAGAQPWSPALVGWLTGGILGFGIIVMLLMSWSIRMHHPTDILRLFTVPLVVVAALLLVIVGFSNDQMTPVIGLLGTLVGYILSTGRGSPKPNDANTTENGNRGSVERPSTGTSAQL